MHAFPASPHAWLRGACDLPLFLICMYPEQWCLHPAGSDAAEPPVVVLDDSDEGGGQEAGAQDNGGGESSESLDSFIVRDEPDAGAGDDGCGLSHWLANARRPGRTRQPCSSPVRMPACDPS